MSRHSRTTARAPRTLHVVVVLVVALLVTTGAVVLAASGLLGGGTAAPADRADQEQTVPVPEVTTPEPPPPPPPDVELTVVAAGDVLTHHPVNASARAGDGYDFTPLFAAMQPWVAGADLALCHMEVPVAPAGTAPSGYPMFGAPAEIVTALRDGGWDGCSTASNHSVDRGRAGIEATLDAFDAAGLGHVGTARTAGEAARAQVYELTRPGGTVRVAHLATTYGTNGIPVPADAPWSVTTPVDTEAIVADAKRARDEGADVVLVSVHCCVEYVSDPTDEQQRIATELATSGVVDLLIGHHAHVPQPVVRLDGGPGGDGMWVAYGLGNYVSNQGAHCCSARTDSGLLLTATLHKPADGGPDEGGPARVTGVEWTAVTVDRGSGHRVEPMPSTALEAGVGGLGPAETRARWERVAQVVGDESPERTSPPAPTGPGPVVVPRASSAG